MELRDDEQFAKYLKQFRPLTPQRNLSREPVRGGHDGVVWLTAVAAVWLLAAFAVWTVEHRPVGRPQTNSESAEHRAMPAPLTISNANALLVRSHSIKAALNEIAFQRRAGLVPSGSRSALEVLGQEKTKL